MYLTFIVFLTVVFSNLLPSTPSSNRKLVFLRGTDVVTANGDGSGERVLVHDNLPKSAPVWSPDGAFVAYAVSQDAANKPGNPLGDIVVLATDDGVKHTVPVATEQPDGTMIDGMRFIEHAGWYSNTAVFASGSANPRVSEYRIMDINTGKVIGGYLGNDFATCAVKSLVAYISDEDTGSGAPRIDLNGKAVYSGAAKSSIREIHWSIDCQRLAFLEEEEPTMKLVVLNGNEVEAKIPVPSKDSSSATIATAGTSFLVMHDSVTGLYQPSTKTLESDPAKLLDWRTKLASQAAVIERLHAEKPDWWQGPTD
ncbi:MAG TPA: hypothetical protein VN669_13090 [Candidatus Acidoferrales bacterium]|nr:hypothetical protein [Candidatus Acidoferrales bacterium]